MSEPSNNDTITKSGEKLYLDSLTADVYFVLGSDDGLCKRIPAHKNLLAAASDVFKAMFYGPMKEEGDVEIEDVSAAAFEEFLQFFYVTSVKLTEEHVADVMSLGDKYDVTKCVDLGFQFIKEIIQDQNICMALGLAFRYDNEDLRAFCEKFIMMQSQAVFKATDFLKCSQPVLKHILKMNTFSCSETVVFEACMSWAKFQSGASELSKDIVQTYLGDSFYDIRFASMTIAEFATLNRSSSLFTANEIAEIIQMIVLPSPTSNPTLFNEKPRRKYDWNECDVIACKRYDSVPLKTRTYEIRAIETTTISVNKSVILRSFECECPCSNKFCDTDIDLPVDVQIFEVTGLGVERIISSEIATLPPKICKKIVLDEPVHIKPGFFYKIQVRSSLKDYRHFIRKLKKEVTIDSNIRISFYKDKIWRGDSYGLIISLDFIQIQVQAKNTALSIENKEKIDIVPIPDT